MRANDPNVVFMGCQSIERHIYDKGMRAGVWSQSVDIPTLAYQKPDAYPRHVETVEPSLDVEPNLLGFLMPLPLEYALGDSRYCGVMTSLDGIERLCETPVVVVNLWWPFGIRNPCIIPAFISYISIQRADVAVPLLNGYSKPGPTTIAAAIVCTFLNRWVWDRNGECDVAVVQRVAYIWRERDSREIDKFLTCDMIDFDQKWTMRPRNGLCLAYLERLRVPVFDLFDRLHATQAMREFIQFFGSMR